jgi:hypothetical protein
MRGCCRSSSLAEARLKLRECPNVCDFAELESHILVHCIGESFGDAAPVCEVSLAKFPSGRKVEEMSRSLKVSSFLRRAD